MNYSKIAGKIRHKLTEFSGNLSVGLSKPAARFINEMLYGITSRQSVLLSEVVRSLDEPIPQIKTENRLSSGLRRDDLGKHIMEGVLRAGANSVGDDTLLILDISDIAKKHARAMEHLARVHDGSEGTLANGYWTVNVVSAELSGKRIKPLYGSLYSQESPAFISENHELLTAVGLVSEAVGRRGIWVMDRGGDRPSLFNPLLDDGLRFLIRLRGDRKLAFGRDKTSSALDAALNCPMMYTEQVTREQDGKPRVVRVEFGARRVRLPWRDDDLWLVVVKGFGKEPLMLLTNTDITKSRKSLWRVVRQYITRWEIEETIRYVKQCYGLENVRVRKYEALRNLFAILQAVVYFATAWMGQYARHGILAHHAITAAKRFFGSPEFVYYAIADGVGEILRKHGSRRNTADVWKRTSPQLALL